jgi:hypothetical protein
MIWEYPSRKPPFLGGFIPCDKHLKSKIYTMEGVPHGASSKFWGSMGITIAFDTKMVKKNWMIWHNPPGKEPYM